MRASTYLGFLGAVALTAATALFVAEAIVVLTGHAC